MRGVSGRNYCAANYKCNEGVVTPLLLLSSASLFADDSYRHVSGALVLDGDADPVAAVDYYALFFAEDGDEKNATRVHNRGLEYRIAVVTTFDLAGAEFFEYGNRSYCFAHFY
jgi:hypothetical protein